MSHTQKTSVLLLQMFLGLFSFANAQTAMPSKYQPDSIIAGAREIIGLQQYCALVTMDSLNQPNIRTMNPFAPDSEMVVWIATSWRTRKAQEIQRNPNVCLYYADHSAARGYVAIKGRAYLVDDPKEKEKRKREYWKYSFPDFKYLVLIKVVPERMEVLNYGRGIVADSLTWMPPSVLFPPR